MTVYAPLLGNLWRTLKSYGVDPGLVIEETLYRPGNQDLINTRVSFSDYDAAVTRAMELVNDPAIGIRSAEYIHPSHLGALGHAWMASSSLRTALLRLERFSHMFNEMVEIQVRETSSVLRVSYRMTATPNFPEMLGDAHIANILSLCRMNFGQDLDPVLVRLKRKAPPDPALWLKFLGPSVRFDQAEDCMDISLEAADAHLTGSNSELVLIHEQVIQRYLKKLDRNNILNRTRICIMDQLPSGRVTVDDVAHELNLSKRTFCRKLGERDESFRSLLQHVRMDLSRRYIQNPDYSITEIAFLLGYTDTSAFSRAFKSWFRLSPSSAREQKSVGLHPS